MLSDTVSSQYLLPYPLDVYTVNSQYLLHVYAEALALVVYRMYGVTLKW